MIEKEIEVINKLGLHARPCSLIVQTAAKFRSKFEIVRDDQKINGKSILGLMMLAAEQGAKLKLIADGVDEEYLIIDIEKLFINKFNEE